MGEGCGGSGERMGHEEGVENDTCGNLSSDCDDDPTWSPRLGPKNTVVAHVIGTRV